ncbi:hypothetical protein HN51_000412 [Arachis hypogaea]
MHSSFIFILPCHRQLKQKLLKITFKMAKASLLLPCLLLLFIVVSESRKSGMVERSDSCVRDRDCQYLFCPQFPKPCRKECIDGGCGCNCHPPAMKQV